MLYSTYFFFKFATYSNNALQLNILLPVFWISRTEITVALKGQAHCNARKHQ